MNTNQTKEDQSSPLNSQFPIVGIGASAGGLEAFTELLRHLPNNTGMAYVLIQHLSPDYHSLLAEILSRETQMSVREAQEGMIVEPDHIYVIPPNMTMTIVQGALRLTPRQKTDGRFLPIDAFLHSLAKDRKTKAIAVILSGSDGDGAAGIKAIKEAHGITFAQCEESAKFQGMPNIAMATGQVDFILPPQAIAEELVKISSHPYMRKEKPAIQDKTNTEEESLSQIFLLLQKTTGVDFTHYKRTTIKRRIGRRLVLHSLAKLSDYLEYLQEHPAELETLYQDMLIVVTQFFRDPEAFAILRATVFPQIIQGKSVDNPVRVWVPGCATGEEVYSLAISWLEFLEDQPVKPPIQIFGTDLSETAIDKAREGTYQENQMGDISAERRNRFFTHRDGGYQITKRVRELCVFARHNLANDPPFSHLDLISCRNVLIYFTPYLQKRVLSLFHYSLKPNGFLFLGSSENVGEFSDLFTLLDIKSRIYVRSQMPARLNYDLVTRNYPVTISNFQEKFKEGNRDKIETQADQIILNRYGPVGVVCTERLEILQFRGDTSTYLRPAAGQPSFNLLKMTRPSLVPEVRTAIYQAKSQDNPVRKEHLSFEVNQQKLEVTVDVIPFKISPGPERYFLVLFDSNPMPRGPQETEPSTINEEKSALEAEIVRLRQELADQSAYLQATVEEQDATNQSLAAANEEILSSNEELQSTNEELQTAKEEIQATNEELKTTNEELQHRILEARQSNDDLLNLLSSIDIPVLMLERDLRIRRFTPAARRMLNLIPSDIGRPLNHIRLNIEIPDLENLLRESMDTPNIIEREIQAQDSRWYILRIRPYKTTENQIDGAMLTLLDIDNIKRSAIQIRVARNYAQAIVETVGQPLIVLDRELRVESANQAFYEMFQVLPAEIEKQWFFELGNGHWELPQLRSQLEQVLADGGNFEDFLVEQDFQSIGRKSLLLNARELSIPEDGQMILIAMQDITLRQQLEAERNRLLEQEQTARLEAEAANRSKDYFISLLSHELRTPLSAIQGWSKLLLSGKCDQATTNTALEAIARNVQLQSELIDDLLDISRLVRGELHLECLPVSLPSIILATIDTVKLMAEDKNIQLESTLESCPTSIYGDPKRLQQIFWNLLTNAIKFTPERGRVEIRLTVNPSLAQVQVMDTGQGISAEFLPHVFERFRQGDDDNTKKLGGLGLGLAIAKELVEKHGGRIWAESPGEGQGATFTVELPLMTTSTPSQEPNLEIDKDLSNIRVLLVENNRDLCNLVTIILEEAGATVRAVTSAAEALTTLTQFLPAVVISELNLPDRDGYSLMQAIRALPPEQGGQVAAISLTASLSGKEQQKRSKAAGFQKHLPKPIDANQLISAIIELVQNS